MAPEMLTRASWVLPWRTQMIASTVSGSSLAIGDSSSAVTDEDRPWARCLPDAVRGVCPRYRLFSQLAPPNVPLGADSRDHMLVARGFCGSRRDPAAVSRKPNRYAMSG